MKYNGLELLHNNDNGFWYFENTELLHDGKHPLSCDLFLKKYGLSESRARSKTLDYVIRGSASWRKAWGGYLLRSLQDDKREFPEAVGWFDHTRMFYDSLQSQYVITTQPYNLAMLQFQALERFCDHHNIICSISYTDAWWYPGRTPLVTVSGTSLLERCDGTK